MTTPRFFPGQADYIDQLNAMDGSFATALQAANDAVIATAADRVAVANDKAMVAGDKVTVVNAAAAVAADKATVAANKDTAVAAANTATTKAGDAGNSATAAAASATSIQGIEAHVVALETSAVAAVGTTTANAGAAATSAALAANWADKTDGPVVTGRYSAAWWAQQVQASITGALIYRGGWSASANTFPPAPVQGDFYKIIVAGTLGGYVVKPSDDIIYNGVSWDVVDNTDSVASVAGKQGIVLLYAADLNDATAAGRALLTAADVATQRAALALGGAALLNVGTTAGTVAAGDHTHTPASIGAADTATVDLLAQRIGDPLYYLLG